MPSLPRPDRAAGWIVARLGTGSFRRHTALPCRSFPVARGALPGRDPRDARAISACRRGLGAISRGKPLARVCHPAGAKRPDLGGRAQGSPGPGRISRGARPRTRCVPPGHGGRGLGSSDGRPLARLLSRAAGGDGLALARPRGLGRGTGPRSLRGPGREDHAPLRAHAGGGAPCCRGAEGKADSGAARQHLPARIPECDRRRRRREKLGGGHRLRPCPRRRSLFRRGELPPSGGSAPPLDAGFLRLCHAGTGSAPPPRDLPHEAGGHDRLLNLHVRARGERGGGGPGPSGCPSHCGGCPPRVPSLAGAHEVGRGALSPGRGEDVASLSPPHGLGRPVYGPPPAARRPGLGVGRRSHGVGADPSGLSRTVRGGGESPHRVEPERSHGPIRIRPGGSSTRWGGWSGGSTYGVIQPGSGPRPGGATPRRAVPGSSRSGCGRFAASTVGGRRRRATSSGGGPARSARTGGFR